VSVLLAAGDSIFDQWFGNFWVALILKTLVVMGAFLTLPLGVGYVEHKVLAHMQARIGPMEAGKFHGWAQLVADGVKFVQKEDVVPAAADPWVFSLAPAVALIPYIALFVVIPFSASLWAANKFSLIGALRAAAQLIAYELPLVLAAAAIVMQAGSLSLVEITQSQQSMWFIVRPWQWAGFVIFMIASLAELTRPPFDMPIADSEIIFGAYTEYTGLKFAFFLLSEYGGIVALSAIASVLFLGGYNGPPFVAGLLPQAFWMLGKIGALSFVVIWLRATYPRLREDQLQRFSWLVLIPLSLVQILAVATIKVATA
jgi:NADH-quinone oxidoreductase subunit H